MKSLRNTKIVTGRKVAYRMGMGNNAHHFQGEKSQVKVTRRTNAETESALYLLNEKAYELLIWYTGGERRPVKPTSAMTSKVKGQGRDGT